MFAHFKDHSIVCKSNPGSFVGLQSRFKTYRCRPSIVHPFVCVVDDLLRDHSIDRRLGQAFLFLPQLVATNQKRAPVCPANLLWTCLPSLPICPKPRGSEFFPLPFPPPFHPLSTPFPPVRPALPLISRWVQLLITPRTSTYPVQRKIETHWGQS